MRTWPLDTNAKGDAQQQIDAQQAGQYRLSYRLEGRGERGEGTSVSPRPLAGAGTSVSPLPQGEGTKTIEGGYLFTVVGEGFDGAQFRFDQLELVPDKRNMRPAIR